MTDVQPLSKQELRQIANLAAVLSVSGIGGAQNETILRLSQGTKRYWSSYATSIG